MGGSEIPQSMAEHWDLLYVLCGVFIFLTAFFFWRMISRIEKKNDTILKWIMEFPTLCQACKDKQKEDFVLAKAFSEWQNGRNGKGGILDILAEIWEAINHHAHNPKTQEVIRK